MTVCEKRKLIKYNQFIEAYGTICSTHSYNQLISALRRDWKEKINSGMTKLLVCQTVTRNLTWLKGYQINKIIYKFYLISRSVRVIPYSTYC